MVQISLLRAEGAGEIVLILFPEHKISCVMCHRVLEFLCIIQDLVVLPFPGEVGAGGGGG